MTRKRDAICHPVCPNGGVGRRPVKISNMQLTSAFICRNTRSYIRESGSRKIFENIDKLNPANGRQFAQPRTSNIIHQLPPVILYHSSSITVLPLNNEPLYCVVQTLLPTSVFQFQNGGEQYRWPLGFDNWCIKRVFSTP